MKMIEGPEAFTRCENTMRAVIADQCLKIFFFALVLQPSPTNEAPPH
jgi:hypothetical protein